MILKQKKSVFLVAMAVIFSSNPALVHAAIGNFSWQEKGIIQNSDRPFTEGAKIVYLTLDADMSQGMHARYLQNKQDFYDPKIFSYLEDNHVPATFFVSGLFAETYPELVKNLAAQNIFSFQNHSYDESGFIPHCYWLKTLTTDQEKINQINKTQTLIKNLTGQTPAYFRFPGICHDKYNDRLIQSLGLKLDNGSVIAGDPFNRQASKIIRKIINQTQNNSVILMHVGGPNAPTSLTILKAIVPALKKQRFIFEKL